MKSIPKLLLTIPLLLSVACGGGGGTTPEAEASYEGAIASSDVARGEVVWAEKCAGCHTEQDGAYGPRVAGGGSSAAHMREQVREGSGLMPGFGESQIPAADLEALLAFLATNGGVTP